MRFHLRTLMIALAIGPPVLAIAYWLAVPPAVVLVAMVAVFLLLAPESPPKNPAVSPKKRVVWSGWRRMRLIGSWTSFASLCLVIIRAILGWDVGDYWVLALITGLYGGIALVMLSLLCAFMNLIVIIFLEDFNL